jgi:NhaP-type Na+/H+ or K+/H+ antiporter
MNETVVLAFAALLLAWSVVSGALARHNVTGPLLFIAIGYLLSNPDWGPVPVDIEAGSVHTIAEITLALVLFSDASRVNAGTLRRDMSLPLRLLVVGQPLTLIIGALTALLLFDNLPWSLALFIGATLAPTDAALSAQVIDDQRVPMRLRRALNFESGLNDGIATPIVTLALALAATALGLDADTEAFAAGTALRELALGALAGVAAGAVGAIGINLASARHLALPGGRRMATLATALTSFGLALSIDANSFIAAFAAGIACGALLHAEDVGPEVMIELPELGGEVLALAVWFLAGAGLVPFALHDFTAPVLIYALLSLTVLRMLPVALAMARSKLPRRDVVFLGWFGPRGLASVVFALLAVEALGEAEPVVQQTLAAVAMTVLLSVILHGVTAGPTGRQYADARAEIAADDATQPRLRSSHVLAP